MWSVKTPDTSVRCAYNVGTMTPIQPIEPFVFTFPHDGEGKEVKYRFMLTLSKPLSRQIGTEIIGDRLMKAVGSLDGVEAIGTNIGRYSIEVALARTFDPDVVIAEIKRLLNEVVLSEIIRPPVITV